MDLDLWDCFGRKKLCPITEEIGYVEKTEALYSRTLDQTGSDDNSDIIRIFHGYEVWIEKSVTRFKKFTE